MQHRFVSSIVGIIGVSCTFSLLTACTPSSSNSHTNETKPNQAPDKPPTQGQKRPTEGPITSSYIDKIIISAEQGRIVEPFQAKLGASKKEILDVFGKPQAPLSQEDYYSYDQSNHQTSFLFKNGIVHSITYHWNQKAPVTYQEITTKLGKPIRTTQDEGMINLDYTIGQTNVTFVFSQQQNLDKQKLMQYTITNSLSK